MVHVHFVQVTLQIQEIYLRVHVLIVNQHIQAINVVPVKQVTLTLVEHVHYVAQLQIVKLVMFSLVIN